MSINSNNKKTIYASQIKLMKNMFKSETWQIVLEETNSTYLIIC